MPSTLQSQRKPRVQSKELNNFLYHERRRGKVEHGLFCGTLVVPWPSESREAAERVALGDPTPQQWYMGSKTSINSCNNQEKYTGTDVCTRKSMTIKSLHRNKEARVKISASAEQRWWDHTDRLIEDVDQIETTKINKEQGKKLQTSVAPTHSSSNCS